MCTSISSYCVDTSTDRTCFNVKTEADTDCMIPEYSHDDKPTDGGMLLHSFVCHWCFFTQFFFFVIPWCIKAGHYIGDNVITLSNVEKYQLTLSIGMCYYCIQAFFQPTYLL